MTVKELQSTVISNEGLRQSLPMQILKAHMQF